MSGRDMPLISVRSFVTLFGSYQCKVIAKENSSNFNAVHLKILVNKRFQFLIIFNTFVNSSEIMFLLCHYGLLSADLI